MTVRYYIWYDPDRAVKIEDGVGYIWRDGAWHVSPPAWRHATGCGGDADCFEVTEEEAMAVARATPPSVQSRRE